jgi:hypothetical protein
MRQRWRWKTFSNINHNIKGQYKKELSVEGCTKYLVQVQCQPSPVGYEEQIVQSLSRNFDIKICHCVSDGFTVGLQSNHPLAYGAVKDLADLVIEVMSELDLRLLSGVISRVEGNSPGALAKILRGGIISAGPEARKGILRYLGAGLLGKIMGGVFGGARLAPVLYFHQDVVIDLVLAAKARSTKIEAALEPN